ncbi:protein SMG9 [Trifolium repens]|nr:protein SMG9 [Trifolium repens]
MLSECLNGYVGMSFSSDRCVIFASEGPFSIQSEENGAVARHCSIGIEPMISAECITLLDSQVNSYLSINVFSINGFVSSKVTVTLEGNVTTSIPSIIMVPKTKIKNANKVDPWLRIMISRLYDYKFNKLKG